jgi:hypothetical protein
MNEALQEFVKNDSGFEQYADRYTLRWVLFLRSSATMESISQWRLSTVWIVLLA